MDIHVWISTEISMCNIQISTCGYPHQDVDIYMDILRDIHVQHLDIYIAIWDIYMPSIIPQPLATDPSHGRAKIAAIYVKAFSKREAGKEELEHGVQLCPGVHSEHSLMDTRVGPIENSLMDPTEGRRSTKRTTGCALLRLTWFLRAFLMKPIDTVVQSGTRSKGGGQRTVHLYIVPTKKNGEEGA